MALFDTVNFAVARISGAATIVYQTGEFTSIARTSGVTAGSYDLTLFAEADQNEWKLEAHPLSGFPLSASITSQWVSDSVLRIRTSINGSPADIDFYYTMMRARVGGGIVTPTAVPAVAPSPDGLSTNQTIYVGSAGVDTADGTNTAPVLTFARALELIAQDTRRATTIQLGWDAVTQAVTGQTLTHSQRQTYVGGHPFGASGSPLLIQGGFTDLLGLRSVSLSKDAGGTQISDVQDAGLVIAPSASTGSLVTGVASGQVRYSDAALINQLGTIAPGDIVQIRMGENPGDNGSFPVAAVNNAAGTIDVFNGQATPFPAIVPGAGVSITIGLDAAGVNRVVTVVCGGGLTSAINNHYVKIVDTTNPINNGWYPVTFVNATTCTIIAPQAVTAGATFTLSFGEPNNGALYFQRSYEGCRFRFVTAAGTLAQQPRTVRDHGVAAQYTATFPAASALPVFPAPGPVLWTIPDGITTVVRALRNSGTDGYGLPGPNDIDFTPVGPPTATGAQCAAIAAGKINTTLPSVSAVRAYASLGNALLILQNMRLGSAGNTVMTQAPALPGFVLANPTGTEISANRAGFGSPLNTFRINYRWTIAPAVGNTFLIERPNCILDLGAADTTSEFTGDGGVLGMRGLVLRNNFPTPSLFVLLFFKLSLNLEGCWFDGRGGGGAFLADEASFWSGGLFPNAPDYWANETPNPFGSVDTANGNGLFSIGMNVTLGGGAFGIFNMFSSRNCNWTGNAREAFLGFSTLDIRRGSVNVGAGHIRADASSSYFGRIEEQLTLAAGAGLINFASGGGGNASGTITQIELLKSGGDAIRADQGATPQVTNAIGFGNNGAGLRTIAGSSERVVSAGLTVTGAGGDMKVGNRAARTYTSFSATSPIGSEVDPNDDSRIATATPQNYTETRTGVITVAAGLAFVDIPFSAYMNGAPVVPGLNSVNGALTSILSAVWQGGGVLRVTGNAAPAVTDVNVSAAASFAQT